MAKGLRSSVKKSNRTKLRARVFQPVESARAERIHAKLLEIVRQPKPEAPKKAEMEVDSVEEGRTQRLFQKPSMTPTNAENLDTTAGAGEPKEGFPKGSCFLTAKIPHSLTTEGCDPSPLQSQEEYDMENLFLHLGLSSDIVGFSDDGDLELAFDPLPQQWLSDHRLTATA
jgi:hypothetical protein